jgi:CBS domain containing-hemolysin-like protein
MTNSDSAENAPPDTEPSSPTAPALARGPSLWTRLRAIFAFRTMSLRDDLEVALESEASGETADFSPSERTILQNVLQLGDKHVEDVMVPRADIVAIEIDETMGAAVARFRKFGHSRIPAYAGNLDDIKGFIHVKDALRRITAEVPDPEKAGPVKLVSTVLKSKLEKLDIVREVLFVPPLMPVGDLLQQMQLKRVHMAIVIDEYGGTDGLVTIEDLLEAVVGEIEDEHDEENGPLIRKVNSNIFIASARAEIGEVEAAIPDFEPGEIVRADKNFEFEVMQADTRQIRRVKIRRIKQRGTRGPKGQAETGPEQKAAE